MSLLFMLKSVPWLQIYFYVRGWQIVVLNSSAGLLWNRKNHSRCNSKLIWGREGIAPQPPWKDYDELKANLEERGCLEARVYRSLGSRLVMHFCLVFAKSRRFVFEKPVLLVAEHHVLSLVGGVSVCLMSCHHVTDSRVCSLEVVANLRGRCSAEGRTLKTDHFDPARGFALYAAPLSRLDWLRIVPSTFTKDWGLLTHWAKQRTVLCGFSTLAARGGPNQHLNIHVGFDHWD